MCSDCYFKYRKIHNFILRERILRLFVSLLDKKQYGSILAKKFDVTYSHVNKIINELDDLTIKEKEGRIFYIRLNNKGNVIAENFKEILELLDNAETLKRRR